MKTIPMKPIRYDQRQMILMVQIASFFHKKNEPLISFQSLGIKEEGEGYVWNPR